MFSYIYFLFLNYNVLISVSENTHWHKYGTETRFTLYRSVHRQEMLLFHFKALIHMRQCSVHHI